MPLKPNKKVNENTDCRIKVFLTDFDGAAILSAAIVTALYTLIDKRTQQVINSKSDLNVKSLFADVDSSSYPDIIGDTCAQITMVIPATDNIILSNDKRTKLETHIARFTVVATIESVATTLTEEVWVPILNLTSQ